MSGKLPVLKRAQCELFSKFFFCDGGLDHHHGPDKEWADKRAHHSKDVDIDASIPRAEQSGRPRKGSQVMC